MTKVMGKVVRRTCGAEVQKARIVKTAGYIKPSNSHVACHPIVTLDGFV